jgi:hypothetical protein
MTYYEKINTEKVKGFEIVFSIAYEDSHPKDCFDYEEDEMRELCDKIDRGVYSWFIARVEAYKNVVLLGTDYLGGCLYENPMHFIKESGGYYGDMVKSVINEAENTIELLYLTREQVQA